MPYDYDIEKKNKKQRQKRFEWGKIYERSHCLHEQYKQDFPGC